MAERITPEVFIALFIAALEGEFGPHPLSFAVAECADEIARLRSSGASWEQIGKRINEALVMAGRQAVPIATIRGLFSRKRSRGPPLQKPVDYRSASVPSTSEPLRRAEFGGSDFLKSGATKLETTKNLRSIK